MTSPVVVCLRTDQEVLIRGVAEVLVEAARREEAVGLLPSITVEAYLGKLSGLLTRIDQGDAGLLAAVDDTGRVVGTVQWQRSTYDTRRVMAEINKVSVAPPARGHGLAKALIETAAADARDHGVELLTLEVRGNNRGAIDLYRGCGFTRTGKWVNGVADGDARHDVVSMARDLGRPPGVRLLGSLPVGGGASLGRGEVRTERLLLSRPEHGDADAHFAIHGDPATNLHNPAGPQTNPAESAVQLAVWERHWHEFGFGYWTVRDPGTGETLGFGGVRPRGHNEDGLNLYYRLRPSAWGHGYAQELARAALETARRRAPGEPVLALIRPDNTPSIKVAERVGLVLDGSVDRELGTYLRYRVLP